MNWLRALAAASGAVLLSTAVFAALTYAWSPVFLAVAVVGVLVAALPAGIAHGRRLLHRRHQRWRGEDTRSGEKDRYYVSNDAFPDRERAFDTARDALADTGEFERIEEDSFPEGRGLLVRHGGFHGSFLRMTGDNRLVLAGASVRTGEIASMLDESIDTSFERSWANPMRSTEPVSGALRSVLTLLVVVVAVCGVVGVATAAYPSPAYNPAEKTVFVSHDVRAALGPGTSATDATIAKTEFRVSALEEADTEVMWVQNNSTRVYEKGRDAYIIAADVRTTVSALESTELTASQRARLDSIPEDLRAAEVDVADALEARVEGGNVTYSDTVLEIADALRNHEPGTHSGGPPVPPVRSSTSSANETAMSERQPVPPSAHGPTEGVA